MVQMEDGRSMERHIDHLQRRAERSGNASADMEPITLGPPVWDEDSGDTSPDLQPAADGPAPPRRSARDRRAPDRYIHVNQT